MVLRLLPLLISTKVGRIILVTGIVVVVGGRLLGVDVLSLFAGGVSSVPSPTPLSEADQEMAEFVSVVLADTEDTWNAIFSQLGRGYREPTLVLFRGRVDSACGSATAPPEILHRPT